MIVGLGASAKGVIERFHGQEFTAPRQRLAETAELLRAYWKKERFSHDGAVFHVDRALELGARPVQPAPPIFFATMAPASVKLTAQVADGWLPAWIPFDRLEGEIRKVRAWAAEAGREPSAVAVRSPGTTVVADASEAEAIRRGQRETLAFFIARNGEFYARQFDRQGLAAEAAAIREAWNAGGRAEAVAAMPADLEGRFNFAGSVDECVEHLRRQAALGVDIHMVGLAASARTSAAETLRRLVAA